MAGEIPDDEQDQVPRIGRPEPQILPPVTLRGINVPMPGMPEYGTAPGAPKYTAADAGSRNDVMPIEEQQPRIGRPQAQPVSARGITPEAATRQDSPGIATPTQAEWRKLRGVNESGDNAGTMTTPAGPETTPTAPGGPFIGPQALRQPRAIQTAPDNAAPMAAPNLRFPSAMPVVQPRIARPTYTGGAKAMRGLNVSDVTQAAQDARSAYAAGPTAENKEAYDRAELARKEITGSGISQIGNPALRTIARIGDVAGSIAAPGIMSRIPGTTFHHNLQVGAGQRAVGQDVEEAAKEKQPGRYITPRQGGGIYSADENRWMVPPTPTTQKESPTDQRNTFAHDNPDMFADENERKNFVLYGNKPQKAAANPNEWQLRLAAANGDKDAQRALGQRFGEEKKLAGIRATAGTNARASTQNDKANAETVASRFLNVAKGDPDKALQLFDQHSARITDPEEKRLGPMIRQAIRARKQINRPDPMQQWLDQMPPAEEQP